MEPSLTSNMLEMHSVIFMCAKQLQTESGLQGVLPLVWKLCRSAFGEGLSPGNVLSSNKDKEEKQNTTLNKQQPHDFEVELVLSSLHCFPPEAQLALAFCTS